MFPFHSKPELRPTFEKMFFEHYSRLLEWALQFTRGDRSEAEDLVQELYVRFAKLSTTSEHIENSENYLFSVLRNLHYARVRRARTSVIDDLSIVDYDSAERSLRAADRNGLLFIRADLHRVCDYLCERKNTSRSASIFILRYFLGYFPNEVMRVVQSTRVAIDKAIQAVRAEARLDLQRPGVLRQITSSRESKARTTEVTDDPHSLFLALRSRIFSARSGECFGLAVLESKYKQPDQSFTTEQLAHLVCCTTCLDQANRILGLPLLDDRSPDDTIGRDTPQGPGASGGLTPTLLPGRSNRKKKESVERSRARLERRAQEANQHRPQHLVITVDGDFRASQRVTAELSELQVELGRTEKPTYIEVLSEQGICLAFVLVQSPNAEGALYQARETELSDGRTMKVVVSFTAEAPTIQVVYRDPLIVAENEVELADALKSVVKPDVLQTSTDPTKANIFELPGQLWHRMKQLLPLNMNPLLTSAMLLGVCSIICFLLWTRSGPRISAGTLLNRAEQSEASVSKTARSEVIYQKVKISGSGHAMERAIYRDPERKRRPKQQHLNADDQWLKDRLNIAGVGWDEPLSAANYIEWHDQLATKQDVVTRTGSNLLTLTTSTDANGPVLKESLTVRESDFHPVERTIELRNAGTVEVAELNYDVMPWGAVNQDWFEPLPGQSLVDPRHTHPSLSGILPRVLSDSELDEAELSARLALNQLNADTGEQIHVSRSTNGIQVKGIVDTNRRKSQLIARLVQVPNVHPSLLSVEELGSHPQFGSSRAGQPLHVYSVEAQPSPLEQYLREKKMSVDNLATISQGLLDGCLRIQQAQSHLSELQQRFKGDNQLPDELRNQFTGLSQSYINSIRAGLDADQHTLMSLGFDNGNQTQSSFELSPADEHLDQEVRHYQELCQELIASGPGQSRPAPAIANDLIKSGALIRSRVAQIQTSASTANNQK